MATTTNFALETPTPGGYRNTWGGTLNTTVTKLDELVALALPLGTIQMYPLATAPVATTNGGTWLLCNGASLSRVTYATLFALIGTTYGNVDGNTFNVPDMRARSPLGYNTDTISGRSTRALALGSGVETHVLTEGELAAHSHPIPATTHDHDVNNVTHTHVGLRTDSGAGTEDTTLAITDSGHGHTITGIGHDYSSPANDYSVGYDRNEDDPAGTLAVPTNTTGITIADHKHTFSTNAVGHGITTTESEVIGITSTNPDTGSNTPHENMHPYLVINYIILAKHPSF